MLRHHVYSCLLQSWGHYWSLRAQLPNTCSGTASPSPGPQAFRVTSPGPGAGKSYFHFLEKPQKTQDLILFNFPKVKPVAQGGDERSG